MTIIQLVSRDKGLIQAFKRYSKRYLAVGKKPDVSKFLSEATYRTMRLEGEKVTRKTVQAIFR